MSYTLQVRSILEELRRHIADVMERQIQTKPDATLRIADTLLTYAKLSSRNPVQYVTRPTDATFIFVMKK